MPVSRQELARRLRVAREARGLTQEDVAEHLEVSRPTVAQMELGNRAVTSLELDRLARFYGRDLREFLVDDFQEQDALAALFRADAGVAEQSHVVDALRNCVALGREVTNLERLLGVDHEDGAAAVYPLPAPRSRWQAVQQGERVAAQERQRLGIGSAPVGKVSELLESQNIRAAWIELPKDVSGLTMSDREIGVFIVVNASHPAVRRRFSFAHEYAHALLDRERLGTVSRTTERDDLLEVRANAFAAAFLLPTEGVRQFMAQIGKGGPSRQRADVFDEGGVIEASTRAVAKSQDTQMYDVAELAEHFGVSRLAALYRLRNLRLVSDAEFAHLKQIEDSGYGKTVARLLLLPEVSEEEARDEYRHRFLSLVLEAFRRNEISRSKLNELGNMIGLAEPDMVELLESIGWESADEPVDVLAPPE
ncbi:XRE family transcriptional regulator [Luteitalea sp.]|uniref:helix-turn-helix domain-containing protein n=1 Tax=Luteitalea sp. TaxID=2004800 RepID=UPI0025BD2413|nr:XRE family transcriptional regulator [Luteitalea sp.]